VKFKLTPRLLRLILPRFFITFVIILFVRSGTFLPVPGLNHNDLEFALQRNLVTQNLIRTFLGDNVFIIGLFTLNIFPAINSTIILQFLIGLSPALSQLQKEGDFEGRREISRLTRKITVILAIVQSIGIILYLRPILFDWNILLASEIVIWLTAGAMIVLWLSDVITEYGLGNGPSIFIYVNIVSNLPNIYNKIIEEKKAISIVYSDLAILTLSILIMFALYAMVVLQNSTFQIDLISAKRLNRVSNQNWDDSTIYSASYLPLKLNQAGVMPVILTTSFLVIPNYLINLKIFHGLDFLNNSGAKGIYWIGYIILIFVFSSFYSSIVLKPKDISDEFQKATVKIPNVRPGIQTTYYLKQEIKRITFVGAALLAFITIVPNFIESTLQISSLNGLSTTSVLILGGVVLDLKREITNIYYSEVYRSKY
jgi:preprotein translocase subunit SecY